MSKLELFKRILKTLACLFVFGVGELVAGLGILGLIACWVLGAPVYYWVCAVSAILIFAVLGAYAQKLLDE